MRCTWMILPLPYDRKEVKCAGCPACWYFRLWNTPDRAENRMRGPQTLVLTFPESFADQSI